MKKTRIVLNTFSLALLLLSFVMQPHPAVATTIWLDPTTDPIFQGYTPDGDTNFLQVDSGAGRITINDTSFSDHLFYYRAVPDMLTREIKLQVLLKAMPVNIDSDTGVRMVLDEGQGGRRIEIAALDVEQRRLNFLLADGTFSTGVQFDWTAENTFVFGRDASGNGIISVAGVGEEMIQYIDLPAGLYSEPSFEFGAVGNGTRVSVSFGQIEDLTPVPIPSTFILFLFGSSTLLLWQIRRRHIDSLN